MSYLSVFREIWCLSAVGREVWSIVGFSKMRWVEKKKDTFHSDISLINSFFSSVLLFLGTMGVLWNPPIYTFNLNFALVDLSLNSSHLPSPLFPNLNHHHHHQPAISHNHHPPPSPLPSNFKYLFYGRRGKEEKEEKRVR